MKIEDKKTMAQLSMAVLLVGLASVNGWAVEGLDSITADSLAAKIGKLIRVIGGFSAAIIAPLAALRAAWQWQKHREEAIESIKGGVIGTILALVCWALGGFIIGFVA